MVSATNVNCLPSGSESAAAEGVAIAWATVERGGVRTIGEVLAEMLPRYSHIAQASPSPVVGVGRAV